MIRFIVETVSSATDTNGNRYHFATVTSTKTGRYLYLDSVGGDSNAHSLIKSTLELDWEEIHSSNCTESIRRFNEIKRYRKQSHYEHEITLKILKALEDNRFKSPE
jgi:hypothetical protein